MRREQRRRAEDRGMDLRKILYISGSLLAIAVIGFVITFFVYGNRAKEEVKMSKFNTVIVDNYSDNTQETSSQFGKTVNEVEETNTIKEDTNVTKYAVNTSNSTQDTEKESTAQGSPKTEVKVEQEIKDPDFKMPVKGEIVREYAKDKLVYSNTLQEWITHNGIDIKANKTTVVKASAKGVVKSIKNDPRYGLTVVVEHIKGYSTVYSNLLTAEFVVAGENVEEGQTIGTVGNTATFEISDEPHLHFEICKDGEYLDPELYIKQAN